FLAKQLVEGGIADVVLAAGFEKMATGSVAIGAEDREPPLGPFMRAMDKAWGTTEAPIAVQMFGHAAREHMERYGTTAEQQAMATDTPSTFDGSMITLVGAEMTRGAARQVYEQSGYGPEDVQVIELHDCFSANEILTYEALRLCPEGQGGELVASGATSYGG